MALILSYTVLLSALVALVLITVAVRLMRAMVDLAVLVLVAVALVWGLAQYHQTTALQAMARQIAAHVIPWGLAPDGLRAVPVQPDAGMVTGLSARVADQLVVQVRPALSQAGLDPVPSGSWGLRSQLMPAAQPAAIHATGRCMHGLAVLALSLTRSQRFLVVWGPSAVQVPLSPALPCGGAQ